MVALAAVLLVSVAVLALLAHNRGELRELRSSLDEKLHSTLDRRLGESFSLVSERLERVHQGLGEMQTLAAGVGDLKKLLGNVKSRGHWGEVQLDALLDQFLSAEQYTRNVVTRPGASERVDFAIRLPGRSLENDAPVWLPVDAKFPLEDYLRLLEAEERGDPEAVAQAGKGLEVRLRLEARKISEKYLEPPFTTDFGILYLATESLFAEALRRPGLLEALQNEHRVTLAGPTTIAALLSSLQLGFRTVAIEQRSSEVREVLVSVQKEFSRFGESLVRVKDKLGEAARSVEHAETRSRAVERKLRALDGLQPRDDAED